RIAREEPCCASACAGQLDDQTEDRIDQDRRRISASLFEPHDRVFEGQDGAFGAGGRLEVAGDAGGGNLEDRELEEARKCSDNAGTGREIGRQLECRLRCAWLAQHGSQGRSLTWWS